jgi:hypothetical protein
VASVIDARHECEATPVEPREPEPRHGRVAAVFRVAILAGIVALLWLTLRTAGAQSDARVEQLAAALHRAVATADGRSPVAHCRHAGPRVEGDEGDRWARCDRRMRAFAALFVRAGVVHRVDPWLLAAMASRESGLSPWAEGGAGELGIMQLHPRGIGREAASLLRRPGARERCEARVDACQRPVIERAAAHLRRQIERCGSEAAALGAYNRGACGETDYSRRVLRRREELHAWAVAGGDES